MAVRLIWRPRGLGDSPSKPLSRSSHGVSIVNREVFVFGGEHNARIPIDSTLYTFALDEDEGWKATSDFIPDAPEPRVAHSQTVVGDCIYFFGGRQGKAIDEKCLNDLHVFNTKSKAWKKIDQNDCQGSFPCPRSFHAMTTLGNSIFIFGGCGPDGQRLSDLFEFDTLTLTWISHPSGPMAGRGGSSLLSSPTSKLLYVLGGFCGYEMDDVYTYSLEEKAWNQLEVKLPEPRSVFAACTVKDFLVVFGGELSPSEHGHEGAGNFTNSVVLFKESADKTLGLVRSEVTSSSNPLPRGWLSGAAVPGENRFFVFGGLTGDDANFERIGDLWECSLESDAC